MIEKIYTMGLTCIYEAKDFRLSTATFEVVELEMEVDYNMLKKIHIRPKIIKDTNINFITGIHVSSLCTCVCTHMK